MNPSITTHLRSGHRRGARVAAVAFLVAIATGTAVNALAQVTSEAILEAAALAPPAAARIAYGSAPSQFAELRVPEGPGPHPVVVHFHGGCWLNQFDIEPTVAIAESLRRAGMAVWNVEYRRLGDEGGGAPGTFDDLRAALDALHDIAPRYQLDLDRIALTGHSAGGQLALWLASEPGVAARAVVSMAGITDLVSYAAPSGCGASVGQLLGGTPDERPDAYRAYSPVLRPAPPATTRVALIIADEDFIVRRSQADAYLARFPATELIEVPGGHFDFVAPWTEAWQAVESVLADMLSLPKNP